MTISRVADTISRMTESKRSLKPLPSYLLGWLLLLPFIVIVVWIHLKDFSVDAWDLIKAAFKGELI